MDTCSHSSKHGFDSQDNAAYRRVFRLRVFKLIEMGYDRLDASKYKNSDEPDITGELAKEMEAVTEDTRSPDWISRLVVQDERPINAPGRLGKRRKKIDILIQLNRRGRNPRYYFEAKRLSGTQFTAGKYLGSEGLGEFLSGHYARDESEAGMLGYVQSGTLANWAEVVHHKLEENKSLLSVCQGGEWTPAKYMDVIPHIYQSKHDRPSLRVPIAIYHMLLDFC
jgi:hypothetical protein